jgi:hypothetical protein
LKEVQKMQNLRPSPFSRHINVISIDGDDLADGLDDGTSAGHLATNATPECIGIEGLLT